MPIQKIKFDINKVFSEIKYRTALALNCIGSTIQQEARQRTPIRTGNLRLNWSIMVDERDTSVIYVLYNRTWYSPYPAYYDRDGARYTKKENNHLRLFNSLIWNYASNLSPKIETTILDFITGKYYDSPQPDLEFDSRNIKTGRAGMAFKGVI